MVEPDEIEETVAASGCGKAKKKKIMTGDTCSSDNAGMLKHS